MKRKNNYIYSSYYQEHFNYWVATWRHGTKKNSYSELSKYVRKSVKEFNAGVKRNSRSNVNILLKQIDVSGENAEETLTAIFNAEKPRAKWYWFC